MKAYRYKDNVLVEVPYQGYDFREPIWPERFAVTFEKCEIRIKVGIVALDLEREERRSGIPSWFKPNLSRRKRCVAWAATPAIARASMEPRVPPPDLNVREMRGHRFVSCDGTEVVLYLDVLERPTEGHEEDMARAMAGLHALTVEDVKRYANASIWRLVPETVLEGQVGFVREAFRARTGLTVMKPHEVVRAARMVEDLIQRTLAFRAYP